MDHRIRFALGKGPGKTRQEDYRHRWRRLGDRDGHDGTWRTSWRWRNRQTPEERTSSPGPTAYRSRVRDLQRRTKIVRWSGERAISPISLHRGDGVPLQ